MAVLRYVNKTLLPIKLHYFIFMGALGSVMPFLTVIAKNLGINATAAGLILLTLRCSGFLSRVFFGYLTDYFRNIKVMIQILITIAAISYFGISFIPHIDKSPIKYFTHLTCIDNHQTIKFPLQNSKLCFNTVLNKNITFQLEYRNSTINITGRCSTNKFESYNMTFSSNTECIYDIKRSAFYLQSNLNPNIECNPTEEKYVIQQMTPSIAACYKQENSQVFVYYTYQFWTYLSLAILGGSGALAAVSLSDVSCYEELGDKPELYGRQRLWGTIGCGIATLLAGFLNNLITGTSTQKTYTPGFYMMLILIFIDLFLLQNIRHKKSNVVTNIFKGIGLVFTSYETIVFAITVFFTGTFEALLTNYQFWYLEDLGATQTLFGLTQATQCLLGEVPMFFFSGWFIRTFGHFYCMICVMLAYAIRFGLYCLLKNPWFVLPIELFHGVTFPIFYAAMTGYTSSNAPPGTEATMIGIFGGLYDGLGIATGSFLSGVSFEKLGGRNTFLIGASISLLSGFLLLVFRIFISLKLYKSKNISSDSSVAQAQNLKF